MAEQFNLASAVVEFKTNFAEVADDISDIAKYSKKSFEQMEKQTEQVDKAMGNLQDTMSDVADSSKDLSSDFTGSFKNMISVTGMLSASLSGVMGMFKAFGNIIKRVAAMSFRMLQFGIQSAIKAFQALISVVAQLMQRITQAFIYLATLPFTIVKAVKQAHKSITDMLDDLTKKFVFLQLDIRHIMQLMQRTLLVTAGAMAGVTAAAANFEEQFVVIRRVTEMTERAYYDLERQLRSTASEIGRSATELAELASVGGRLGIEGVQNLERFAEVMGMLGVATVLEGEKAATEFARLMTIMDVTESEMENMASTIVELGNSFAAFEDEILGMSLQLAGAGDAIGLATDELMGLATAMAAVDIRVERGGSAMSRTMIEIANAVQEGGESLDTFADLADTTAEEFAEMFRDEPIDAIFAFLEGLADMEELPFKTLENLNLAQIRTRDTILRLLGAQEQLGRALGTSNRAWEDATALQEEYDVSMQTIMARLRLLRENVLELGRRLGELYADHLVDVIDGLKDMVSTLQDLDNEIFEAVAGLLALISVLVGVTTALLVAVRGFFTIMTALTLLARGIVWAISWGAAIYFAASAFRRFAEILDDDMSVLDLASDILETLKDSAQDLRDTIVDSKLGQITADMLSDIRTEYEEFVEWATGDENDLTDDDWMSEFTINLINMLTNMVERVSKAIEEVKELMEEHSLRDAISVFTEDLDEEEETVADAFIELFKSAFELAFIKIPSLFGKMVTDLLLPELWHQLTKDDGAFEWATEQMEDMTDAINDATDDLKDDDESILPGFDVPEVVRDMMSASIELGKAVGSYFWEGISQAFEESGIGEHILDALTFAQDAVRDIDWETDSPIDSILPKGDTFAGEFINELATLIGLIIESLASALYHQVAWFKIGQEIGRGILSLIPGAEARAEMGTEEAKEEAYEDAEDWEWSFTDTSVFDAFADRFGVGEESAFGNWVADWIDRAMGRPLEDVDFEKESKSLMEKIRDGILQWSPFNGNVEAAGFEQAGDSIYGESGVEALKQILAITKAEAGTQNIAGQAGVIATVFNRVISDEFPDTIEEVIRDSGQFQPVSEGIFDEYLTEPLSKFANEMEALKWLFEHGDPTEGAKFFYNPDYSSESGGNWFEDELIPRDDTVAHRIQDHVFVAPLEHSIDAIDQLLQPLIKTLNQFSFDNQPMQGSYLGLSSGGVLSGYGGGDRIPALLEQGEAVIPKEAVKGGIPSIVSWLKSQGVPQYQSGVVPSGFDGSAVENFLEGTALEGVFEETLDIMEDLDDSISSVSEAIYGVGEMIIRGLEIIFEKLVDFFSIVFNLSDEQQERANDLVKAVTDGLDKLLNLFEFEEPELDPSFHHQMQQAYYGPPMQREEEEEPDPISFWEGIRIKFSSVISTFENELSDEMAMLRGLSAGVSETFENIKQTELGKRFLDWFNESDSAFVGFIEKIREIPSFLRDRLSDAMSFISGFFEDMDLGDSLGEMAAAFDPMIGAIMEIAQESKVFELIMESAGEIISAFIDMIGMLLEPLLPLIRVLEMALVPIFNALGQILAAVFMPILRMLFPVIKTFGIILVTVAQIVGTVWNALLSLISTIPFIDLSSYKIDTEALSEARQDLIDVTWDELRAKEDLEEETKDLTESLKNVPDGFAIAFRRFQSAIGIGAKGEDANLAELKYQSGLINDQTGAIETEQDLLIEQNQILRDGFGLEEEEKDSMFKQPSEDLSALGRIGWGALNPISAIGNFFGLAKGGIATSATKAVIGEAGPEAVIPLDRLDNMLSGAGGGNGTIVVVEGDVYGLKDFERKVQSVMGKYNRDIKGKKYGVGSRRERR